jgi:hypothetical protein
VCFSWYTPGLFHCVMEFSLDTITCAFPLRAAVLNGPTAAWSSHKWHTSLAQPTTASYVCVMEFLACAWFDRKRSTLGVRSFSPRPGRGSGGTSGWLAGLVGRQPGFPLVRWVDSRFSSGSAGRQLVFPVIFTVSDDVKKTSRNNLCFNIR